MTSLANAATETLYWSGYGEHPDWRQRALTICCGNTAMGIASTCFSILMLIGLVVYNESGKNFYLYFILYAISFTGSTVILFWGLNRHKVRQLVVDMQAILHGMEQDFPGSETIGREYVPMIRILSKLTWYTMLAQDFGLAALPFNESACPPSIRGTWITLAFGMFQSMTFICMGFGAVQFFDLQPALILYFRASMFVLADFLRTTDESTITKIARTHGKLLKVCETRNEIFSQWNGIIFFYILLMAILATFVTIRGVFNLAVNAVVPSMIALVLMMCIIGNVLETACERFAQAANSTEWYLASESYKKTLLQVIVRCQKSEILHAKVFGAISYPFFIAFINNYYRFVQAVLNTRNGRD